MQTFKTELKIFLTQYINRNYHLILFGDSNINLLEDKTIANFINHDFSLLNALPNNSVTTNKRTFIDWCFTCENLNVKASVYKSYYSYHKPISVPLNFTDGQTDRRTDGRI